MTATTPSRRERYRAQTTAEAKQIALRQLAEHGPDGLSLNAVARELGMSGPALYRYFANREELVTQLVDDGFRDLATVMTAAMAAAAPDPVTRFRAAADAYREWARAQPHHYLLVFATPSRTHTLPQAIIASAHRSMVPILAALAELDGGGHPAPTALERQLAAWTERRTGPRAPGHVALTAVRTWTRLHGTVSLEIQGFFTDMGIDPALLYAAEVDTLLEEAGA